MFSPELFSGTVRVWRTPLVWWPIGLFLYVFVDGWLVSVVASSVNVAELFSSMPNVLLQTFLGTGATADFARGRYGGFLFYFGGVFLGIGPILAALFAMFLAPGLLAGEWERGTLDTLLARPLRRRAYVLTRFAVFAGAAITTALVVLVAHALVIGPIAGFDVPVGGVLLAVGAWCLVALAFGAIGFLGAAARLSPGAGSAAVIVVLLAMLVLNVAALTSEAARPLAEASFFKHWRPVDMLFNQVADAAAFALPAGVAAVALLAATFVFERRDLM